MHKSFCAVRVVLIMAVLVGACGVSRAAVTVVGDVLPADNISTPAIEGIPSTGNGWNSLEPNNEQSRWETNQEIIVGKSLMMGGRMDIDTNTNLRYTNLIIGDQDDTTERVGTGTVLITGTGAIFSNDPTSLPPGLPSDYAPTSAADRPDDVGFDLWVGRWGQGRFELRNGGRAEIQDAVLVGDNPGASGVVTVDGFGSLLSNGGFESPFATGDAHQMIIGRQGIGEMFITNGGLVVSEGPGSSGPSTDIVGAVIGSDPYEENEIPELGGTGEVTVSGIGSRWIVGGSLQVGGYHDVFVGPFEDQTGVNAIYNSADGQAGRGTLKVDLNALVSVRNAFGVVNPDNVDLLLAIGRFGTVDMRGGMIDVGTGTGTESTPDSVQLVNDGLIKGYGRIETGVFRNRYLGQVRISQGQSLIIDSASEFVGGLDAYPLVNYGRMELNGTADSPAELEFVRPPEGPGNPLTPFVNRRATATDVSGVFDGGLITARHGILRFDSGIQNEWQLLFTEGTNVIAGRVDNVAGASGEGSVFLGPNTTLISRDDFATGGVTADVIPNALPFLQLDRGARLIVEDAKSLTVAGFLQMELSKSVPTMIEVVSGDLGLDATLLLSFDSGTMSTLQHGDAFELMSFLNVGGVDFTDPLRLVPDLTTNPVLNVRTDANFDSQFPNLDLIAMQVLQSFYLFVKDPNMVGVGAIGADFNGDGVVDQADLAIWQTFKGITTGASILQGDADGDGDVDGEDYLKWLEQFTNGGVPMPGGSPDISSLSSSVPEPTGLALLAMGAALALAIRRRRS